MRRMLIRSVAIAAASAVLAGAAASSRAAGPGAPEVSSTRIGYVDFTRALNEVSDGREAKKRLKNEFKEKQQKLNMLQKELASMKEEIDRDRLILSDDALEVRESSYMQKLMDVQRRFADFRREMTDREEHLTEEILGRLRKIVKEMGEEGGYAIILEKSQELVLYAPAAEDLTDRVIREYNSGSKKGR